VRFALAGRGLGLCNSSAAGEKANDLIVSERQKHNGMSWTRKGTVALATITALAQNNEYRKWLEEKDIDFKLAASIKKRLTAQLAFFHNRSLGCIMSSDCRIAGQKGGLNNKITA
jgi:hypothetical protein